MLKMHVSDLNQKVGTLLSLVKLGALTTIVWWIMVLVGHHPAKQVCTTIQVELHYARWQGSGCRDAEDSHK